MVKVLATYPLTWSIKMVFHHERIYIKIMAVNPCPCILLGSKWSPCPSKKVQSALVLWKRCPSLSMICFRSRTSQNKGLLVRKIFKDLEWKYWGEYVPDFGQVIWDVNQNWMAWSNSVKTLSTFAKCDNLEIRY